MARAPRPRCVQQASPDIHPDHFRVAAPPPTCALVGSLPPARIDSGWPNCCTVHLSKDKGETESAFHLLDRRTKQLKLLTSAGQIVANKGARAHLTLIQLISFRQPARPRPAAGYRHVFFATPPNGLEFSSPAELERLKHSPPPIPASLLAGRVVVEPEKRKSRSQISKWWPNSTISRLVERRADAGASSVRVLLSGKLAIILAFT